MSDEKVYGIRLESDTLLRQAVEKAAGEMAMAFCDVSGFGELEWVELTLPPEDHVVRFEGPLQLVALHGRLRLAGGVILSDYVCSVARQTDNGIEMLGGALKEASVRFVEIALAPLIAPTEGVRAETDSKQTETGEEASVPKLVSDSSLPRSPIPQDFSTEPDPEEKQEVDDRWARAIEESNRVQQIAKAEGYGADSDDVRPKAGDIVNHQQFGKCKVMRMGDEHITLRKPDRRSVQLGLAILKFTRAGEEDGHSVFTVQVQPKR